MSEETKATMVPMPVEVETEKLTEQRTVTVHGGAEVLAQPGDVVVTWPGGRQEVMSGGEFDSFYCTPDQAQSDAPQGTASGGDPAGRRVEGPHPDPAAGEGLAGIPDGQDVAKS